MAGYVIREWSELDSGNWSVRVVDDLGAEVCVTVPFERTNIVEADEIIRAALDARPPVPPRST